MWYIIIALIIFTLATSSKKEILTKIEKQVKKDKEKSQIIK
jgi:hypothetical protein